MYPAQLTDPMRAELKAMQVDELTTADEVDAVLGQGGTILVFINSVCGCAAGCARPGLAQALAASPVKPDRVVSVFAGVDREATERARSYFPEFPASSPSAALLKDGEVIWFLHRHQIEGRHPQEVAEAFGQAFAGLA